eukprot:4729866-Ditylum_brightwellii.AAC.1
MGIAVLSIPPMSATEGTALSEFAAVASTQQERSPSMLFALPTKFSPITSVVINCIEKNEAKYMTDVSHSDNPIAEDCRNTIQSEAAVSASATAAIQGRKIPAERRHGLPHVSYVTYNSATTEHSIIVHETKEQILELAEKDAFYAGDGGNSDIEYDENDLHHNSVIEEDK